MLPRLAKPALWARVVTSTCEVRVQCIRRGMPRRSPHDQRLLPRPAPIRASRGVSTDRAPPARSGRKAVQARDMTALRPLRQRGARIALTVALSVPLLGAASAPSAASTAAFAASSAAPPHEVLAPVAPSIPASGQEQGDAVLDDWVWPLTAFRITRAYVAPAHEYGPGHRGIDLAPLSTDTVRTPADGVVAFRGSVAGRPLITIDHGDGLVTTLEPVASQLTVGSRVARGQEVGTISTGGHAAAGTVHFGVRRYGQYINPMLLLGGIPRAVLLPCCS